MMMRTPMLMVFVLALGILTACSEKDNETLISATTDNGQLNLASNRVEHDFVMQNVTFVSGSDVLSTQASANDPLPADVFDTHEAVIRMPANDKLAAKRTLALTRMLRAQGIASTAIRSEPDAELVGNAYRIEYALFRVASPQCPNWSSSPSGSYDNKPFSNFGCATATNIGKMAADPRDLTEGHGAPWVDTIRNVILLDGYKSGGDLSVSR